MTTTKRRTVVKSSIPKTEKSVVGARLPERAIEVPENMRILIFGYSDAGKSLLASGMPLRTWPKDKSGDLIPQYGTVIDDVLFCDADAGLASVNTLGVVIKHLHPAGGQFNTTAHMESIPDAVKKTGVSRVVIDTFSRYQESLMNPRMGSDYTFRLQDWGYIRNVFAKMCAKLTDLGVDLIGTAHADEREDDTQPKAKKINPITKVEEMVHPERIQPAIQGAFRNLVHGHFDVVALYRLEWDAKGNPVRRLYTRQTRRIAARSKYAILPAVIEEPDWPTIKALYTEGREKLITALKKQGIAVIS